MSMNEQQMTDLVERTGDTLDVDVAGLVAGGTARGRARRRRRVAGALAAGLASVAVVGALGYALVPGAPGGSGSDGPTVASSPTPASSDFGPAPEQMGEVLGERLVALAGGEVTEQRGWQPEEPIPTGPSQLGTVLLDGALVEVALWYGEAPECDGRPPRHTCETLPGGLITAGTMERPEPDGGPSGVFSTAAGYYTDSGVVVTARVWNAADSTGQPALSTFPKVTEEQLVELVRDPVWLAP